MTKTDKSSKLSDILARIFGRKTKPTERVSLEELVALRKRKTRGELERLRKEEGVQKKAEILYRLDPLIFAGINRLRRAVVSPRIYFVGGEEEDNKKMNDWAKAVKLKNVLWQAVLDIFIYGYAAIEKVRDSKGNIVKLVVVDPKTIDWQKDGDKIIFDEKTQEPIGFTQVTPEGTITLDRNDIVLLRFFYLGPECLGISPLEPAFKASWIRLNLEEAYGEAIYRHGYPVFYFRVGDEEHPVTAELIKEAKKILKDVDVSSEIILPNWIVPGRLESRTQVAQVVEFWAFLAGAISRALESPLSALSPVPGKESKGAVEIGNLEFERAITVYQQDLKDQLEEQLFAEVRIQLELKSFPELAFEGFSPETQALRMTTISTLVEKGVLSIDKETENKLRAELDLPPSKKVEEPKAVNCVYFIDQECQIRKEKSIPLTELFKYCQQCPKTKRE